MFRILMVIVLTSTVGCASTVVKRSPGPHDRGVRYYRPKPYLLIKPTEKGEMVDISVTQLPDYSEEYSIHVRAGVGTNKTKITLDGGWNLTGLDIDVDSKTSQLIEAFSKLIGTDPKLFGGGGPSSIAADNKTVLTVPGYHVPLGYYEAVLGRSADGGKKLYGWRYVGFMPFNACPVDICGNTHTVTCSENEIYGLIADQGRIVFRKIGELTVEGQVRQIIPQKGPVSGPPPGSKEDKK